MQSMRSVAAALPFAAAGALAAALTALLSSGGVQHCKFEVALLGAGAAAAAAAWLLRTRSPNSSVLVGAVALALSLALALSDVELARNLRALRRLHVVAQVECAASPHKLEWQIVCDVGLGCDETSPFQVSCERDVYGAFTPTQVFLVEGFDNAWVIGPGAQLDRY